MSKVEVIGVELRQFVGTDLTALVPRIIGKTTAAESIKKKREKGRQWDEHSFFEELTKRCEPVDVTVVRSIMKWARDNNLRDWW